MSVEARVGGLSLEVAEKGVHSVSRLMRYDVLLRYVAIYGKVAISHVMYGFVERLLCRSSKQGFRKKPTGDGILLLLITTQERLAVALENILELICFKVSCLLVYTSVTSASF
jgi:hypothetical protein